jgi:phosphoenolpyruvate carboxykinase (GTP)
MWPGFGENIRVLEWVVDRVAGTGSATDTPIGLVPTIDAIDRTGLDVDNETMAHLLSVDPSSWGHEVALINEHYSMIGDRLPKRLDAELDDLRRRLDDAS